MCCATLPQNLRKVLFVALNDILGFFWVSRHTDYWEPRSAPYRGENSDIWSECLGTKVEKGNLIPDTQVPRR